MHSNQPVEVWGVGVAAVPKVPGTAAKSYDLHLTSSYKREYKRSERPRVRGRYKQEESGLNKLLLEGLVVASFLLVESGRDI